MKLSITPASGKNSAELANLKSYLDKQRIKGLESVEFEKGEIKDGEMSGGIVESIATLIEAASSPLTELVKCLQKYVESFKTEIEVKTEKGSVKISSSNPKKAEDLMKIILESQKA